MEYNVNMIMNELKNLGDEQIKQIYIRHGAKEPLYGVTTGKLKPLAKKIGKNYNLSLKLYETGNYDAMYLAGMISEAEKMKKIDFENWIEKAYCSGIAEYTVASTLSKSHFAEEIADEWIKNNNELYASAGWSCYSHLLKELKNNEFNKQKLQDYLMQIEKTIHSSKNRVKYTMNNFVITVGILYEQLYDKAMETAKEIGRIYVDMGKTNCKVPLATEYIQKANNKKKKEKNE